ncbi:Holliday junction resolvase RuvX [Pleomorphovibrio marinus]|uniref:Holliday junction resolvase RuvX n=1 Tax=Pleomorphovibrio marinus TaxID=2164132 RepID=UPI000E0A0CDF|nr:Holliday junction resolvase RuvX [Pleomorphovibrio marinus]
MTRILAIDLGTKRTGLAVTDPLRILANPLTTIPTAQLNKFLLDYFKKESVDTIVIGYPKAMDGQATQMTKPVLDLKKNLSRKFPDKEITLVDERFTSKMAMRSMIEMGSKKKDRREKAGNLDKISATIILQTYLNQP